MLFDTDILIWVQRRNQKAAELINREPKLFISIQTYMELIQGASDKKHLDYVKDFLALYNFTVLPLTENIGHRASVYMESYALASGLRSGDAIIAATATENNLTLVTGNGKHFKPISELKMRLFKP